MKLLIALLNIIFLCNCFYPLPNFNGIDRYALTDKQKDLLYYFENYPHNNQYQEYEYDSNIDYSIISLRQCHFDTGTVRITKPGIYILQEDIEFEPNAQFGFFPTGPQIASGQYPVGGDSPYTLGFFAAITVETTQGVIIDLNGHTIKQSRRHNLLQRFYADIELASAPFIHGEGPASFTHPSTFKSSYRVLVMNGTLGLSSHHGIHGNAMTEIVLYDLLVKDFEQCGIQLNGASESIIAKVTVKNSEEKIPLRSTFSQASFTLFFLGRVEQISGAFLKVEGVDLPIQQIIDDLQAGRQEALDAALNGDVPENEFGNPFAGDGYDSGVYGIVLNKIGQITRGFITERDNQSLENYNISLQDIKIKNLQSKPIEYVALPGSISQDGGNIFQVGPVGDVLNINEIVDPCTNKYKQTLLSNAQLIIAKYVNSGQLFITGTTSIQQQVVDWVENETDFFDDLLNANDEYELMYGGDSMGHIMKGNIGLFISSGDNIKVSDTSIKNIWNYGEVTPDQHGNRQGSNAYALLVTGSTNIELEDQTYRNIGSYFGTGAESFAIYSTVLNID